MTAIVMTFEGREISARQGESIAAALLRHGIIGFRQAPGGLRGPVCGMGVCFECSVEVTRPGACPTILRACATPAEDGMRLATAPDTSAG